MVALILGGRANAKRTLAFEEQFCSEPEGILRKQFTRLGKGKPCLPQLAVYRNVAPSSGILVSKDTGRAEVGSPCMSE